MPRFSRKSDAILDTTHERLQLLFRYVVSVFDCTALEGFRNEHTQRRAFDRGASKVLFPNGKHNKMPSLALDIGPYDREKRGVNWETSLLSKGMLACLRHNGFEPNWKAQKNLCRFYLFAGFVKGIAHSFGMKIRWGGDWDGDWDVSDQSFDDLVHFEYKHTN